VERVRERTANKKSARDKRHRKPEDGVRDENREKRKGILGVAPKRMQGTGEWLEKQLKEREEERYGGDKRLREVDNAFVWSF